MVSEIPKQAIIKAVRQTLVLHDSVLLFFYFLFHIRISLYDAEFREMLQDLNT